MKTYAQTCQHMGAWHAPMSLLVITYVMPTAQESSDIASVLPVPTVSPHNRHTKMASGRTLPVLEIPLLVRVVQLTVMASQGQGLRWQSRRVVCPAAAHLHLSDQAGQLHTLRICQVV